MAKKTRAERSVNREVMITNIYNSICNAMKEALAKGQSEAEAIMAGERCIKNHLTIHPDKRMYIIEARNRVRNLLKGD